MHTCEVHRVVLYSVFGIQRTVMFKFSHVTSLNSYFVKWLLQYLCLHGPCLDNCSLNDFIHKMAVP